MPETVAHPSREWKDLPFDPSIGRAVAKRSYLRKRTDREDGYETRRDLAARVALGNVITALPEGVDPFEAEGIASSLIPLLESGERDRAEEIVESQEDPLQGRLREGLSLFDAIRSGALPLAGRHLQHGDVDISKRSMAVSTNCSATYSESVNFNLLLNGSGCSRIYDEDVLFVDWSEQPELEIVLSQEHPDSGRNVMGQAWQEDYLTPEEAASAHGGDPNPNLFESPWGGKETVQTYPDGTLYFLVPDSREGWAKALELLEDMTWARGSSDFEGPVPESLVLDFSTIREEGAPIAGMQGRPAAGPVPTMKSFHVVSGLRGSEEPRFQMALKVDHAMAETVQVGGSRRSARLCLMHWDEEHIFDFINFKRKPEHRTPSGRIKYYTANFSVGTDAEFHDAVDKARGVLSGQGLSFSDYAKRGVVGTAEDGSEIVGAVYSNTEIQKILREAGLTEREVLAARVFLAGTSCAYYDRTGETAFLNQGLLADNRDGLPELLERFRSDPESVLGYKHDSSALGGGFNPSPLAQKRFDEAVQIAQVKEFPFLGNPCIEIILLFIGAYCVLGNMAIGNLIRFYQEIGEVPLAQVEARAKEVLRWATRFLMRVNQRDAYAQGEVDRTQRIGVGIGGIHEFYMAQFGLSFQDVTDPDLFEHLVEGADLQDLSPSQEKAKEFWLFLGRLSFEGVHESSEEYAQELGVPVPHTSTDIPPMGTTGKLDGLTNGAHLPPYLQYLRNMQVMQAHGSEEEYRRDGYPVTPLGSGGEAYAGATIVGFPTKPFITVLAERLGLTDALTTQHEASPQEQYRWLRLLERFWIQGADMSGPRHPGAQISYTLSMDVDQTPFSEFSEAVLDHAGKTRACSWMPTTTSATDAHGIVEEITGTAPPKGDYAYLPQQPVPAEVYAEIERRIKEGAEEDVGREHLECGSGGCPIVYND